MAVITINTWSVKILISTLVGILLATPAHAQNQCFQPDKLYNRDNVFAVNESGDVAVLRKQLVEICTCESSYSGEQPRHYEKDGETVRYGRVTPKDRGLCQINEYWHKDTAESLGWDIETPYGNIKYANHLYSKEGEYPWRYSGNCHQ